MWPFSLNALVFLFVVVVVVDCVWHSRDRRRLSACRRNNVAANIELAAPDLALENLATGMRGHCWVRFFHFRSY